MFEQLRQFQARLRKVRTELIAIERAMKGVVDLEEDLQEVEESDAKEDNRPARPPDEVQRKIAAGVQAIAGILIRVIDALPTG